ncbi:MAG TPA: universal stress protein [Burkholderiales bacterium]|nr:universal stress protein [Burkholderiales bacterium]
MLRAMDSYKTIVVHLDNARRRAETLNLALGLAGAFDGHLVALYAPGLPRISAASLGEGSSVVRELELQRMREAAEQCERECRDALRSRGGEKTEWRYAKGDALAAIRLSARYADLVVMGQPDRYEDDINEPHAAFPGDVVMSVGRPVLFVPYAGRFASVGARVLLAWNASREAARAVSDALPFLARAKRVEVVAFDPERNPDHGQVPGADIALYLARHGVKASAAQQTGTRIDIGAQILSRAADIEADLIVMGAYGHSRFRELVLGGATRTVLESMTVPVLMSH